MNKIILPVMKINFSMKPIVKWLRELSVVVTGIALTFGVTFLVNNKNNKEDMKQYLTAIKMELEYNAEEFDLHARLLNKPVRYANYLRDNNYTSLDKDSLNYYAISKFADGDDDYGIGYMLLEFPISSMTNAFEMFKASGTMRQIKDKEVLMLIWWIYNEMETAKSNIKDCYKVKGEEAVKELQLNAEGKPVDVPMKMFFSSDLPQSMERRCQRTTGMLKEAISALEIVL